jgi:hypothetical protein
MSPILLLDVDGTLIHDRGYRHAQVEAAKWVCRKRNLPEHTPADHEINVLHACGYSNEWDSVPFNVGINLVLAQRGDVSRPDFAAWAIRAKDFDGLPNQRARNLLMSESPPELHADIHALLDDVRDPQTSETTRLLYNFVLGSVRFEQHYGLPVEVDTPSLLEELDVPLIDDRSRTIILANHAAIYTARPSLPPDGSRPGLYQTPEAEIAMSQLQLDGVPLIGLGPMQWLVDRFGGGMWDYAKPAPVQPIAAMLTATGMPVKDATLAAYEFVAGVGLLQGVRLLDRQQVIVFEDNASGVRACRNAAKLLTAKGIHVEVTGYGVARDEVKRAALSEVCDAVFGDVNQALLML